MRVPQAIPGFQLSRRDSLRLLASGAALAGLGLTALRPAHAAQAWPAKALRIIVPFAPGGGADGSARVLGEALAPQLGQAVIVDNKPGAGSAIGVAAALQSRDGHTLLMGSNSMVINPFLNPAAKYDVTRDFDAVGMVSSQPLVLVVPAASALKSVKDVVAHAKAKPDELSAGNSGTGTLAHIASESFAAQAGIQLTPVAYKGESALMPDLISGQVSLGFLNLPSVLTHIKSGRLRALAVSSAQPVSDLPGVPTLVSQGYPTMEFEGWATLVAPKGSIPPEGLARLQALLSAALESDAVRKRFTALGVAPMVRSQQATGQFLKEESERYAAIIKSRNIKVD
ncbi:Bug family tripartite tricarboxylate transporter substrate binding protein [Variovorax sp. HJSM1_2]|uniref:Bug family tripartite tricarboxylate transporter substrate binding protein n=1 Tax=Variovorax sp. HJSM1_2 TaxID=3366263 RepID=UPI003BE51234